MGAADLDDVGESCRLGIKGAVQMSQVRNQVVDNVFRASNVHGRRKCVIRRLAHVDMVVGVDRRLRAHHAAQHLDRAVGYHLVGVHVGLSA